MLELKFNHVSKRGPWWHSVTINFHVGDSKQKPKQKLLTQKMGLYHGVATSNLHRHWQYIAVLVIAC